jgi:hypothetical protein
MTSIIGIIVLVLLVVLGLTMGGMGAGREFKELMITFGAGLLVIFAIGAVGLLLAMWSKWAGLAFFIIAALYVFDWMIKS